MNPISPPGWNPYQPPDTTFNVRDDISGIAWLFFVNVLIDISLVSGAFLVSTRVFKGNLGTSNLSPKRFFAVFLLAILAVTVMGALIDFYIVTELTERDSMTVHVLHQDTTDWAISCTLIFGSVAISMLVIGVRALASALIGAIVTIFNPVWWSLTMHFGEDVVFLSIFFSLLSGPILFGYAVTWHTNERTPRTEAPAETPS